MKTKFGGLILGIFILAAQMACAQTNDLTSLLQQGLLEEQANRNLDAAIADYQALAAQFDKNRQLAATAIFRLGECYRMLGKTNEAAVQYQRILKDFSDQQTLATLSQQNLTGMGFASQTTFQERLHTISSASVATTDEESQEIQRIQTMIQNSPDLINAADSSGNTPLRKAAFNGWLKVVAYLLEHGADINAGDISPLNQATLADNRAMVEFLLSRGADVNSKSLGVEETPLHTAARKGFEAVVKVLLANKADVNAQNKGGWTPLMCAASANHPEIVKLLLAAGANPNIKGGNGETALNCSIANSPEIFQVLLAAEANPNTEDSQGRTPLSYAVEKDGVKVVKLLLDAKADPNGGTLDAPLLTAIHAKNTNSVELLLQAGANPNALGKVDWSDNAFFMNGGQPTPLWLAISTKQLSMVQLLLKYKADPNDSQTDGRSLLFSTLKNTNILEALLDAGANVDVRDSVTKIGNPIPIPSIPANWTPLIVAVENNYSADLAENLVEILLKHGANPNAQGFNGYTPMHYAASRLSNSNIFQLLLDYNADPNVRSDGGNTPLDILKMAANAGNNSSETRILAQRLADFLRLHGALDVLPDWDHITVSRPSAKFSQRFFDKGTNDWNQVSLFDVLGMQYDLISAAARGGQRVNSARYSIFASGNSLAFPDFANVVIRHPLADGKKWETRKINLVRALDSGDCSADVLLQWGDVVEIPEADHVINQSWTGLTTNQLLTLKNCLTRHLQITVNGQTTNFVVSPQITIESARFPLEQPIMKVTLITDEPFMLWPVLNESKTLLASSDLSRVKIKRKDAAGKVHEWTVDCSDSNSPPNFWLRDGDEISVPEK